MTTTSNSIERVLGFSQTYFREPELNPQAGLDSSLGSAGAAPASQAMAWAQLSSNPMTSAWDPLLSRGIPELASPLSG